MKYMILSGAVALFCFNALMAQSDCSGYFIHFPDDHNTSLCIPAFTPDIFGSPQILGANCDSLVILYTDVPQDFQPSIAGECFEFDRYWTIYNPAAYQANLACTFVPNPTPVTTILDPANNSGPVLSAPNTTLPGWEPTIVKITPTELTATNYSIYWSNNANCYSYRQNFKVFDNQPPIVTAVTTGTNQTDTTTNDATLWNHPDWLDPDTGDHNLRESPLDFGITAMDSCSGANLEFRYLLFLDLDGNDTTETVVNSAFPPAPGNVNYNNENNPNFSDGELRPFDSRLVPENMKWQFGLQKDTAIGMSRHARMRWYNQSGQNTAPELPHGMHHIKWFVKDGCGNETVYQFALSNNTAITDSVVFISGNVHEECGTALPDIFIISNAAIAQTDSAGGYMMTSIPLNTSINACAVGEMIPDNYADEVNVCDMVAVQRHILGLEPLASPYRTLASDVNHSGSVTSTDYIFMRYILFGFYDLGLAPGPLLKWQFINAYQTFPNTANPFGTPLQTCYLFPQIQQSVTNVDFIGFKTGDADGSANGCHTSGTPLPLRFVTQEKSYAAGDTFTVIINPEVPVSALQVVMKADGITFWNPFPANNLNSPDYLTDTIAKLSWIDPSTSPSVPSIEFRMIAQENGLLSEHLHFTTDAYTRATVYIDSCTAIIPELEFFTVNTKEPGKTQVLRSYPNPWCTQSVIELDAPENSEGTLQVTDAAGRVLYTATVQLQQGNNKITVQDREIKGSGMLYFRMVTAFGMYSGLSVKY